eukprot:957450-Rhodomonas_salina.3
MQGGMEACFVKVSLGQNKAETPTVRIEPQLRDCLASEDTVFAGSAWYPHDDVVGFCRSQAENR